MLKSVKFQKAKVGQGDLYNSLFLYTK